MKPKASRRKKIIDSKLNIIENKNIGNKSMKLETSSLRSIKLINL